MKKLLILLLVLISYQSEAQKKEAQIQFKDGSMATHQARYTKPFKTPETFTVFVNDERKKLSPKDIKTISVEDDNYVSRTLNFDRANNKPSRVLSVFATDTITHSMFLLEITKGPINLYKHVDRNGIEHFFIENDKIPMSQLIFKSYNSSKTQEVFTVDYIRQLNKAMKKCPSIREDIFETKYTAQSLSEIIMKYNSCMGSKSKQKKVKTFAGLKLSLHAGMGISSFGSNELNRDDKILSTANFDNSTNPMLALEAELFSRYNHGQHGLIARIGYSNGRFIGKSFVEGLVPLLDKNYTFDFNVHYAQAGLGYKYVLLPHKKINPFLKADIPINFLLKGSHDYTINGRAGENFFSGLQSILVSATGTAGIQSKTIQAYLFYVISISHIDTGKLYNSSFRTLGLGLAYNFLRKEIN